MGEAAVPELEVIDIADPVVPVLSGPGAVELGKPYGAEEVVKLEPVENPEGPNDGLVPVRPVAELELPVERPVGPRLKE